LKGRQNSDGQSSYHGSQAAKPAAKPSPPRSYQQPAYRKGPWSPNEDDLLRKAVKKHKRRMSDIPWTSVAAMVPGRSAKQCRERWRNHVDPSISHAPWSEEENALLLRLYRDHDGKWCEISAALPGRPDEA